MLPGADAQFEVDRCTPNQTRDHSSRREPTYDSNEHLHTLLAENVRQNALRATRTEREPCEHDHPSEQRETGEK